ncbi:MAG: DUF5333 family protein [Roseobacter sp.]
MRKWIAITAISLGLAACSTTGGPAREMPDYFYNALLSSELARTVAQECGESLTYDESRWNTRLPEIAEQMAADGFGQRETQQLLTNLPQDRLRADAAAYIADNNLVVGQPQTFCSAGRTEIANGTEIGSFLRAQG